MKRFSILMIVAMLSQLACQFLVGTPEPTPTATPTPEQLNMGTHRYWRETIEAGCDASDDSKGADYVEKTHVFSADFNTVNYSDRVYTRTDLHRYESINQSDRPLVLIYSEIGFDLEVYNPGEDTNTTPACLIFHFRLED